MGEGGEHGLDVVQVASARADERPADATLDPDVDPGLPVGDQLELVEHGPVPADDRRKASTSPSRTRDRFNAVRGSRMADLQHYG